MTIESKIRVPDELGHPLARLSDRLTEVVERGAREMLAKEEGKFQDLEQRRLRQAGFHFQPNSIKAKGRIE